jgi:hypothetical protein
VSVNFPVRSAAVVVTNDDNVLTLKALPNSTVYSIYDGVVTEVSQSKVTIVSDDVISIGYSNLVTELSIGDEVAAGQKIGYTDNGYISMQLQIEGNVYDILKLFKQ